MINALSDVTHCMAQCINEEVDSGSDLAKYAIPVVLTTTAIAVTCLWKKKGVVQVPQKFEFSAEKLVDKDEAGCRAIHHAARDGDLEAIKVLHENEAELDALDNEGNTPMHYGVKSGNLNTIRLLSQYGAKLNIANEAGQAPIHIAVEEDKEELVRELKELGADEKVQGEEKMSPICIAAKQGNLKMIEVLHEIGLISRGGLSPVFVTGDKAVLQELRSRGWWLTQSLKIDNVNKRRRTPLIDAIEKDDLDKIRALFELGVGVDEIALELAVANKNENALRWFAEAGVDMNQIYDDATPFMIAVEEEAFEMIQVLKECGADINLGVKKHSWCNSPLHFAIYHDSVEGVQALCDAGANPDTIFDSQGSEGPLHFAAKTGRTDIMKILLNHNANPTLIDRDGNTPLQKAQKNNKEEAVKLLTEHIEGGGS